MAKNKEVHILEVVLVPKEDCESLLDFKIDRPQAEAKLNSAEIEFSGWVLGKTLPAIAVEILQGEKIVKTISVSDSRPDVAKVYPDAPSASISGFKEIIDLGEFSGENELTVQAILRDDSIVTIGQVRFQTPESAQVSESPTVISSEKLERARADLERSRQFLEQVKADLAKYEVNP
ncbi:MULTISPECIES: hypothetical protein [Limnospira]|uniref:Sulfotransferase n=2 Tax=Limnospira TaxID=2596745 RepID=B5W8Q4_LIMMA|nr:MULTISPECIES: hypothetical protein [Limnospira]MDC0837091.1 sulfotransferase [Limnoraphis robusta]MDY7052172.1 sulfotransferase [Limnospira fusiformis LS22]QJB27730.1 sulfotransferase [Limnospira fusiformis SAG 85.79]EDZ92111.1 hypothetical protein AmaxDRAFT_5154 [Limnospira maxima CS-328]MDT9190810.1 sulfotransferase [Limnospira sp. PMC 894.15]